MLLAFTSFQLLPFSFKSFGNSSLSNSHNSGGRGVVVVVVGDGVGTGGGIADESFGAVLLSMFVWRLFVSGDER